MNVLLLQLDGKLPNLALMRLAAHHRALGDAVTLRRAANIPSVQRQLWEPEYDAVYGSLIFESTRPVALEARRQYPTIFLGGTGWDVKSKLETFGVSEALDYSDYPLWRQSIGFTQRGCRLNCEFCVVPRKEGKVKAVGTIADIWRGEPWPRELLLLDNDFFGQPQWRERIREIRDGGFKVSFNQGINARFLSEDAAEAIASVDYRDDQMKDRRIYTAWDNREDEATLFRGLERLCKYGVKPRHIMVYILIGYWSGETMEDCDYRRRKLREFGALPYPMPYVRTRETLGFQRWVIGGYDKAIPWAEWTAARYDPRRLTRRDAAEARGRVPRPPSEDQGEPKILESHVGWPYGESQ